GRRGGGGKHHGTKGQTRGGGGHGGCLGHRGGRGAPRAEGGGPPQTPRLQQERERGAYGIRTRAAPVRGRCPRPLDECAGRFSVAGVVAEPVHAGTVAEARREASPRGRSARGRREGPGR